MQSANLKLVIIPVLLLAEISILSSVALTPASVYATVNRTVDISPLDRTPRGSEWTYDPKDGSVCSITPDRDTIVCEGVGEGRPCDEVRNEILQKLTCSDRMVLP
jgi:hypothetical protein